MCPRISNIIIPLTAAYHPYGRVRQQRGDGSMRDKREARRCKRARRSGRALDRLGMPADSACTLPRIVITGDGYVKIEHHRGVLKLSDAVIRLYSSMGVIRVEGKALSVRALDTEVMEITGAVKAVFFEQFAE